jgi:hypothetical protein
MEEKVKEEKMVVAMTEAMKAKAEANVEVEEMEQQIP